MKQTRRDFLQACATGAGLLSAGALAGCSTKQAAAGDSLLRVGVAKREVTPPVWVPYLTSSGAGTCAPFDGVHDPLFARALVLDDGRQALALLAVDAIGYDNFVLGPGRDFTAEVRRRVAAGTGLRPEAVMLASTHAHSTPETIGLTNFRDVAGVRYWLERHVEELAAVAVEAWRQRVPARARFGKTTVTGVARNRRILLKSGKLSPRRELPAPQDIAAPAPVDEELSVLWFERDTGAPHAVVLNYTAHPVVTMLLPPVSADYPGAACRLVEEQLASAACMFTQGAAGNINSVKVATSHADAEAIGRKLGDAALAEIKSLRELPPLTTPRLQFASSRIILPPRDCPPLAEAETLARSNPTPQNQRTLRLAHKLAEGPIEAEVQAMALGPVKWVSLPGEPFVEIGLALKQSGASFVLGYTNGWIGYLPIQRAYQEGGYEVGVGSWSRVAPGSAEKLVAVAKKLLHQTG
ncbi:MAG: twin-arginine translocation signal domain-containing protein [Verrucomicrobia bacterium]|nr:twin-arginine translocation signal domain-containing protein [Verrucomicrobiota bacterium]